MRHSLLILAPTLATLVTGVAAQATVVIPSAVQNTRPTTGSFWSHTLFYSTSSGTIAHDSRTQSIYDSMDVNTTFGLLAAIDVRRPVGLGNQNPATTTNLTIDISTSPNGYASASSTFANNHGTNQTQVFSGPISLPAESNPGSWPAPWQMPFIFTTPFPFVQVAGESLVIDFVQTGNQATTSWYVEHSRRDTGDRASNPSAQSSCRFSNGNYNNSLGYRRPLVGGTWYVNYGSILPNTNGVAALGFTGVGGTWAGNPLPMDLTFLGAPGCSWNVDPVFTVSMVSTASGQGQWPQMPIPNDPSLGGLSFYDHSVWLDAAANAGGLVTGWSSEWIIGTNTGVPGAVVTATGNSALNPTGSVSLEEVPSFRLHY